MAVPALAERAGVGPAWGAGAVLLSWLSVSLVCVMTVIAWMGRRAGIGQAGVGGWYGLGSAVAWSWKAGRSTTVSSLLPLCWAWEQADLCAQSLRAGSQLLVTLG